ncbi:MAG: DJ-1/PfpI family protein [Burkholderiales bacterium]|nr:DJ-1/PfpI family protein [Burkholderiales bacterium]
MAKIALFLIDGFEETEAITPTDILRRGNVEVTMVSLNGKLHVKSKNGIMVQADALFEMAQNEDFDMIVIPGGTITYLDHPSFPQYVEKYAQAGKRLAAICAAPAVFGKLGLLKGKTAVCYPGMESWLSGARISCEKVVTDGNITTSRGPGTAIPFALRLLSLIQGEEVAKKVAADFLAD